MTDDPLDFILEDHAQQNDWCDSLEAIADSLPVNIDYDLVEGCLAFLEGPLEAHLKDEDNGLLPLLKKRVLPEDNLDLLFKEIEQEHQMIEGATIEIKEQLEALLKNIKEVDTNAFGYLLRSFFEAHRRHIAWENLVMIPLAKRRLTQDDLDELKQIMLKHREHPI